MAALNAAQIAEIFINTTLRNNAPLQLLGSPALARRIYPNEAPQGALLPYILFNDAGTSDIRGVGPAYFISEAVYNVKVVTSNATSFKPADDIFNVAHELLDGRVNVPVTGGHIVSCIREGIISQSYNYQGIRYHERGGRYRLEVKPN